MVTYIRNKKNVWCPMSSYFTVRKSFLIKANIVKVLLKVVLVHVCPALPWDQCYGTPQSFHIDFPTSSLPFFMCWYHCLFQTQRLQVLFSCTCPSPTLPGDDDHHKVHIVGSFGNCDFENFKF